MNMIRKALLALALCASFTVHAQAALTVVRNLGTDDDTLVGNQSAITCNLYRGTALVVNTPVVKKVAPASVACKFTAITLQPGESYTATYVGAMFESDPSGPFVTGTKPGAPGSAVHVVP